MIMKLSTHIVRRVEEDSGHLLFQKNVQVRKHGRKLVKYIFDFFVLVREFSAIRIDASVALKMFSLRVEQYGQVISIIMSWSAEMLVNRSHSVC